jgi:hypothetical protein
VRIRNLTPHAVSVLTSTGKFVRFEPEEQPARITEKFRDVGSHSGVSFKTVSHGEVINLPDPEPETVLIVSSIVRDSELRRMDLVSPAEFVRDKEGRILAAKCLAGRTWLSAWLGVQ